MSPSWLWTAAYGGFGLVGLGLTLLYVFQESLLYVPQVPGCLKEYEHSPNQAGLSYKDLWLRTQDRKLLHGWLMWKHCIGLEDIKDLPVVLFFQANAGNIAHRLPFFRSMIQALDCAVVAISYRGYGPSEGSPTEPGLKLDADAVCDFCQGTAYLNQSKLFVFGRSLGGAVAIDLVSRHQDKFAGLIVENTFTSIADMVPSVLPPLAPLFRLKPLASMLIRNKWRNRETIQAITSTPILLLSSGQDEMVPPEQMQQLRALCKTASLSFHSFPDARHMNAAEVYPAAYWLALKDFITLNSAK